MSPSAYGAAECWYQVYDPALYLFDSPQSTATPLSETDPLRPRNLCGSAKLMHEQELESLGLFDGTAFSSISARIFRVYGRGSKDVVSRWVRSLIAEPNASLAVFATEGMFDYVSTPQMWPRACSGWGQAKPAWGRASTSSSSTSGRRARLGMSKRVRLSRAPEAAALARDRQSPSCPRTSWKRRATK